ncbi:MAG TPA: Crp/Fnr family transcriptional regulator [Methylophilaceae bacterium]|nr:Crp/Fnr family transcriptional regulator [Methylophilaceae bacterium]
MKLILPLTDPALMENRLLTALPQREQQHIISNCECVELEFAEILYEPEQRIRYVYFPCNSFVSMVATLKDKDRLEVGMTGYEGMIGISVVLGISVSSLHAVVQGAGVAWRMKASQFRHELERNPTLRRKLQRYIYVMMKQRAQTAACTHFHLVEQRLARWLLMTQDRARSNELHLTQEFLSYMLGVRRVGISNAASSLNERNLITYSRGEIKIIDRPGLIEAACECYEADKEFYESIMG